MKRDCGGNPSDGPQQKFPKVDVDLTNVVIRFLIPKKAAGIMIGRGGENIKKIRSQYNVKLNIPESGGPERIMTIEGDLDAICNIMLDVCPKLKDIMSAKLSDPKRIMGGPQRRRGRRSMDEEDEDDNKVDFRILVHESQAGSVIGRGGERIKNFRMKHKMRVIKVYQMLAPMSTDRVVQMVADPENVISCLKSVIESVESAPPRGRRHDYDACNCVEQDALCYGGWLSSEAVDAMSHGMPPMPPGPGYGMGNPYMGGGNMGSPMGGMPPIMNPMMGNRNGSGPGSGNRGRRGGMAGGGTRGMGRPGPTPVPPPSIRGSTMAPPPNSSYGGNGDNYGQPPYDNGSSGYDSRSYGGPEQTSTPYGGGSYPNANNSLPSAGNYSSGNYATGDSPNQSAPTRGGYGGYNMMGSSMYDGGKANQWYGGWS